MLQRQWRIDSLSMVVDIFVNETNCRSFLCIICITWWGLTASGKFGLDNETGGARVFEHVAPGLIGYVVATADGSVGCGSSSSSTFPHLLGRPWATIAAGDTAWPSCGRFRKAGLSVPAPYGIAGRRLWEIRSNHTWSLRNSKQTMCVF